MSFDGSLDLSVEVIRQARERHLGLRALLVSGYAVVKMRPSPRRA
jgi:hypothetical protein